MLSKFVRELIKTVNYIKHVNHVNANSFSHENIFNIEDALKDIECLLFDTESCADYFGCTDKARVYGWGLGQTRHEYMVYGQTLNQFFDTLQIIAETHFEYNRYEKSYKANPKTKKGYKSVIYKKIPVAVHNLGWDVEFLKYHLFNNGYKYQDFKITTNTNSNGCESQSVLYSKEPKSFNIAESDGQVYGCQVFTDVIGVVNEGKKSKAKIVYIFDFFDMYKIIQCKESDFNKYVNNIDSIFFKMNEEYDYDKIREVGHIQDELELRYQYNDIYMMRVALEQFYIDNLCNGDMKGKPRTASSIAFSKLVEITFGLNDKGLPNKKAFEEHFELGKKTNFELTRKRIENKSYQGGYTHANYKKLNMEIYCNGSSLDINSSYPSQMAYKKFPYGRPIGMYLNKVPKNLPDNQTFITEIGFTWVKPKKKEYDLPIFKIGALNSRNLKPFLGQNVSGNEYFSTNVFDDKYVYVYREIDSDSFDPHITYQMVVTQPEYEFLIQHFEFGCEEEYLEGEVHFNGLAIGKTLVYKAEIGLFREYVEYFTKMKIENKKLGNKPVTASAKLFLNSAYGKLGTNVDKYVMEFKKIKDILTFDTKSKIEYTAKEFYKPYASFVTAYGRLQLWNAIIHAVGVENFLYCDTDSIYTLLTKKELISRMESIEEEIDKTKLGKWDIEHEFDIFKMLGQKKYMLHDKKDGNDIRCCGLPRKAQLQIASQGFEEFYLGKILKVEYDEKGNVKEGCKLAKKRVNGGALLLPIQYQIGLQSL